MMIQQKHELKDEVARLIGETKGYADALEYIGDVACDVGVSREEAIVELQRQCGRLPVEDHGQ